jgi:hypothetical protein
MVALCTTLHQHTQVSKCRKAHVGHSNQPALRGCLAQQHNCMVELRQTTIHQLAVCGWFWCRCREGRFMLAPSCPNPVRAPAVLLYAGASTGMLAGVAKLLQVGSTPQQPSGRTQQLAAHKPAQTTQACNVRPGMLETFVGSARKGTARHGPSFAGSACLRQQLLRCTC